MEEGRARIERWLVDQMREQQLKCQKEFAIRAEDQAKALIAGSEMTFDLRDKIAAILREAVKRDEANRKLAFLEGVPEPSDSGWCCEHPRRFQVDARNGDEGSYDECQKCRAEKAEAEVERLRAEIRERLSFTLDDGECKVYGRPADLLVVVKLREQAEQQKALLTECLDALNLVFSGLPPSYWARRVKELMEKLRAALGQQE